jgi:hypothetical protein
MGTLRKYKHFILLVTIPVLLLFISNSLFNRHSHLVRGYLFYHAHPFKKQPDNRSIPFHNHTDAELILLDLLSDIDILVFFMLATILFLMKYSISLPGIFPEIGPGPVVLSFSPRGPPVYTI